MRKQKCKQWESCNICFRQKRIGAMKMGIVIETRKTFVFFRKARSRNKEHMHQKYHIASGSETVDAHIVKFFIFYAIFLEDNEVEKMERKNKRKNLGGNEMIIYILFLSEISSLFKFQSFQGTIFFKHSGKKKKTTKAMFRSVLFAFLFSRSCYTIKRKSRNV